MMSNEFEQAFDEFLEHPEYDGAENAIFALTRAAFLAGWLAAGGEQPQTERVFQVLRAEDRLKPTEQAK